MDEQKRYSQYEDKWKQTEMRVSTELQLAQGFNVADIYLNRTYLDGFSAAPIIPAEKELLNPANIRVIQVNKLVLDKKEQFTEKLKSVYSAIHSLGSAVALIIHGEGSSISFSIGIRSRNSSSLTADVLESALKGNFPGISFQALSVGESAESLSRIRDSGIKSMASVSTVPSMREEHFDQETFVQGMEKFVDTMTGKSYTAICIATPLDDATMQKRKHGYEELFSSLSPHAKLSVTYGVNESTAVNTGVSSSFSKSVNRSVSNSNSVSNSSSSGTNSNSSSGSSYNGGYSQDGWSVGWGGNSGYSSGSFDSYTSGNSFTNSISNSTGTTDTESVNKGKTESKGTSKSITLTYENKGVNILMERAQAELERFKLCESFGMWDYCAYFVSEDIHTTALASNTYKALMAGNNSHVESTHLNIWGINQMESIKKMLDYVLFFAHPQAEMPSFEGGYEKQLVTPTNMISGHELPFVMGFPKKSVSGLAVIEMAEFGRSVVYENVPPDRAIEIGSIYHMGITERPRVRMDLDLLASHCFITGSSGSGKSYATYQLLDQVVSNDVKMMVIEPAKGEYKQVFGGLKGIKIFTTDPNAYRLLRINPFQFPSSIHILSHIEQLLQIFNASWPLYAAMPAILKQAVVKAYVKCGWDIQNSIWIEGISKRKFPVFTDVLEILPQIINASDYSGESKGNYKGALVTRVQAMTEGINGLIFKNSEGIDDALLFDSNVVVDLSELGSDEAIALIMGILIMKLSEYRKAQRKIDKSVAMNSKLRHVTVLEEAHNLLKRTSKEQNQEGANMIGKSVEMISNSIKEMRTYGEGFIIIDQSPMAVDTSAIENTATKIIMNTPAKDACEELGSALSLNELQTGELSRLNTGVAAVFQKGWLSPVLMKVDMWDNRYNAEVEYTDQVALRIFRGEIVTEILNQSEKEHFSPMKLRSIVRSSELTIDKKREIEGIIASYNAKLNMKNVNRKRCIGQMLMDITECNHLFSIIPLRGIPTHEEYALYDPCSKEFSEVKAAFDEGVSVWFETFYNALSLYLSTDSDEVKVKLTLLLVYSAGYGGVVKYYPHSRLAMLCRMLYRKFNYEL